MLNSRAVSCLIVGVVLAVGCVPAADPSRTDGPTPGATGVAATVVTPTHQPSSTARITELRGELESVLDVGTYRLDAKAVGKDFPRILLTVPEGWGGGGAYFGTPAVTIGFWDVDEIYGHPCQWTGTLFDPGPTVDDLVDALVDVPLRNATQPRDVTLDGYSGKYLEWTVPIDMEADADANFSGCDKNSGGFANFNTWTGQAGGRYQQGPGQVDRLWILDLDGSRLVIDAEHMPSVTPAEIAEQLAVVNSIRFER